METDTQGVVFENPMDVQWDALYDEEFASDDEDDFVETQPGYTKFDMST